MADYSVLESRKYPIVMTVKSLKLGKEYPPVDEELLIQEVMKMSRSSMEEKPHPPTRRDQHPKSHAYLHADFIVNKNIPKQVKVGVFKIAKTYSARIRFSNGSSNHGQIVPDSVGDFRGLAIKLLGVEGKTCIRDSGHLSEQDFILINHPTFFIRDVEGYTQFFPVLDAIQAGRISFNPDGSIKSIPDELKEKFGAIAYALKLVKTIKAKTIAPFNPLEITYWSATPSKLGNRAMKFSVTPRTITKDLNFDSITDKDNYLREIITKRLANEDIYFDFKIQLQTDPVAMPIEDPTVEWDEKISPFVKVATIRIPRQDFNTEERKQLDEKQSFSPWHSLVEHQPFGGLNRARRIYSELAKIRNNLNNRAN
jgi:catalase